MMKFLPFEQLTYRTPLTPEEVAKRIDEIIEPKKMFRMTGILWGKGDHKPYEGVIDGRSFKINRIIGYRNSFLPIIKGTIERDINGTKVEVSMRLNGFVMAFLMVWMGGVALACVAVFPLMNLADNFNFFALIPFAMLIFAYGLTTGGFKYESSRSKKDLAKAFEATIEPF